jgi:hypothetical protein
MAKDLVEVDVDLEDRGESMYRTGSVYVKHEPPKLGTPEHEEYIAWLRDQFQPPKRQPGQIYRPEMAAQARKLYRAGWIDDQVAEFFEVSLSSIYLWRTKHKEFAEACRLGKEEPDDLVEEALYKRARGYDRRAEKVHFDKDGNVSRAEIIEHYPPDPKAAMNWLKNRRPKEWKDRREVTGADGAPLHPVGEPRVSKIELARRVMFLVQRATDEQKMSSQIPHIIEEKVTIHE